MITVDSSAVISALDDRQDHHQEARAVIEHSGELLVLPVATLGEIGYIVERRFGRRALSACVSDLAADAYELDVGIDDFTRVQQLIDRYADLPLGFVDAAVIACAERNGGRVLTYDYRHFGVVAGEGTITLVG